MEVFSIYNDIMNEINKVHTMWCKGGHDVLKGCVDVTLFINAEKC